MLLKGRVLLMILRDSLAFAIKLVKWNSPFESILALMSVDLIFQWKWMGQVIIPSLIVLFSPNMKAYVKSLIRETSSLSKLDLLFEVNSLTLQFYNLSSELAEPFQKEIVLIKTVLEGDMSVSARAKIILAIVVGFGVLDLASLATESVILYTLLKSASIFKFYQDIMDWIMKMWEFSKFHEALKTGSHSALMKDFPILQVSNQEVQIEIFENATSNEGQEVVFASVDDKLFSLQQVMAMKPFLQQMHQSFNDWEEFPKVGTSANVIRRRRWRWKRRRCKTKFICTLGPASSDDRIIRELILNGMSLARLNFSHCSHEFIKDMIRKVRRIAYELRQTVGILLDLNGPKLRTGNLPEGKPIYLEKGDLFIFYEREPIFHEACSHERQVQAPGLAGSVLIGDKIFVDDGLLAFTVKSSNLESIECAVENSGWLGERKGINLSHSHSPTARTYLKRSDRQDLLLAREEEVEFVAISCVRNEGDVEEVRHLLQSKGSSLSRSSTGDSLGSPSSTALTPTALHRLPKILAKIENKPALESFEAILACADGIIIDRGYLGVEIDLSRMTTVKKLLVQSCMLAGKPVLVASNILEGMRELPRPSRSEASDISSTASLGIDGFILSGETAIGAYPIEALQWMRKICFESETHLNHLDFQLKILKHSSKPVMISESIASSTVKCAREVDAACIIVSTEAGGMARLIAKYRPNIPIVAGCGDSITAGQLALSFGINPVLIRGSRARRSSCIDPQANEYTLTHPTLDPASVVHEAMNHAHRLGLIDCGNRVVVASGQVDGFLDGSSTFMQVITVGEDCQL